MRENGETESYRNREIKKETEIQKEIVRIRQRERKRESGMELQ